MAASAEKEGDWSLEEIGFPQDLVEIIVALLSVRDVCALSQCSRCWFALCSSDAVWLQLFRRRWPSLMQPCALAISDPRKVGSQHHACLQSRECKEYWVSKYFFEGWRAAYVRLHFEMANSAKKVVEFVKMTARQESLEVADYHKAMDMLCATHIAFQDVIVNLLLPSHSVLINLIGLHYSLVHLGVQMADAKKALVKSNAAERQVCLRWWSLGRWMNGFRRQDEMHVKMASLLELTEPSQNVLLQVIKRGTLHEVLRVQISADFKSSAWLWRDMHSQR
ncbi:hypothetical protein O6H91_13G036700 [Diphasiastrum complanatum]|uniref:Uncharacterized protein n=2 Tax=Diphasiastrum complanatum TaxID=34168 RepID=A0ACC2BUG5_DIPCM|nr:hypothetical protein O6H91_13G013300 [Diphasiastrum complanatum]KAJ7533184.1 hypothetical protein O6H91_13G036700 [Diphasiastrum complanatum]